MAYAGIVLAWLVALAVAVTAATLLWAAAGLAS
jgi:hypothetical protein